MTQSNSVPPNAPTKPHETTHHGHTRNDPYAWLKDENWQKVMHNPDILNPDIRAYLEAENNHTNAWMSDTIDLQRKLFEEMRGRIKEDDSTIPDPDGTYMLIMFATWKGDSIRSFVGRPAMI